MTKLSKETPSSDLEAPEQRHTYSSSQESLHGLNEKSLVRKLDYKLLPVLTLLYLLSFLGRSNVGNARIEGLVADLDITGNEYLTGLTLFFVGYVIFEVPCNIVLKLWTPRMWLPTIALAWGVVSTLMGVIENKAGFLAVRFILGVSESGLFPGIVYVSLVFALDLLTASQMRFTLVCMTLAPDFPLPIIPAQVDSREQYFSLWYRREERNYRVALFFSAAALAGAFGGILAWGIAHMRGVGGYNGWRWIFISEGLLTVLVALGAYFFVHNYPSTATFLTENERDVIQRRLKSDSDATNDESFNWVNVRKALTDPKVYLYCFNFHTMSLPLYTLSLFLPSIIRDLGYSSAQAQLLTVPPYAIAFITTMSMAVLSERYKRRAPFIIGSSSFAIIGYILLLADSRPGPSYTGTIFAAAGIYPSVALVLAWPASNVSGQTKRAVANGLQISIGNLGAVLGTQLYRTETAPRYFLGHSFAVAYLVANVGVASLTWYVLKRDNEKKERRIAAGELAKNEPFIGDEDVSWRFHL